MKKGKLFLVAAIVALVGLNLWRFGAASNARETAPAPVATVQAPGFQAADFRLRMPPAAQAGERERVTSRDLFALPVPPQPVAAVAALAPASASAAPPPKTPEQLEEEAARAELAQIKLVAVMFSRGKGQAYLAKGDQTFLVAVGDKAARFTVDAIAEDGVKLSDPRTRVSASVPISGR